MLGLKNREARTGEMACDSGAMGEVRPRKPPPRDAQAAAAVGAPHMEVLEQPRGELLLGAAARYAPAQLGAVVLLRRRALDDVVHYGIAEKRALARTAETGPETALLLPSFSKALGQLCKGSAASTTLYQEISTRLPRLATRVHGPVECARLQLTQTLAAQTHSARAQVVSPTDNSTGHLMSYLQIRDPKSVRLLAEKTREIWEVSYIDGMEECVTALAGSFRKEALGGLCKGNMLGVTITAKHSYRALQVGYMNVTNMLLMGNVDVNEADPEQDTEIYLCRSVSSNTQGPRIVWLLLKNGAGNFQGNIRDLTPVHSTAAKRNYKALQDYVAPKNGSMSCVKPLLHFGANTKVQNLRKHGPILMAAVQDMCFNINSASMVPWDSSLQKNQVVKKDSCDRLLNNESDDSKESCTGLKTACHWHFVSSNCSAQVAKIKSQSTLKQDSKFVPQKHGYVSKIFMGCLPTSVNSEYLITAELGHVKKAVVTCNQMQSQGSGFLELEREEGVVIAKDHMLGNRLDAKDAVDSLHAELQRTTTLSSRKGYFRVVCIMELSYGVHGYYKLRDSIHMPPGICRMCAVPAGNGSAPEVSLLLQPKCGTLLELSSFQIAELPESDLQFPMSSLNASITVDSQDIDGPQLDACSKSNVQIQQNDECSRRNTSHMGDACRTRCEKVPIFITHCFGEVLLTVYLDKSSDHMMHLFEEKTKMKLVYYYFKYGNNMIDPNCTLLSYGVGRNARIDACARLLGGMSTTLEDYFRDNRGSLVREVTLPDGNVSLEMTDEVCRILSTWLTCFTWAFSKGKSWNGQFSLKDFIIVEGHVRIGTIEPKKHDLGSMQKDITAFVDHVKNFLCSKKKNLISEYPSFLRIFTHFIDHLFMTKTISEEDRLFLETHVSCTTSSNWGKLILKLHRRYKGLHPDEKTKWDDAIEAAQSPAEWYTHLSKKTVFKDFIEQAQRDGITYDDSKVSAFYLMRDVVMHGLDHNYIVKFPNCDKLNLMISAHLEDFLPSIIENLIKRKVDICAEYGYLNIKSSS